MRLVYAFLFFAVLTVTASAQQSADYRNPSLPIDQRVADLLRRMTLEEKVEQIAGGQRRNFGKEDPGSARIAKDSSSCTTWMRI